METAVFKKLLSPYGQEILAVAGELRPREPDFLAHFTRLSKRYPAELARAALETAILRLEGEGKFGQAGCMYFTRAALEQASAQAVSEYRARRYVGYARLIDLGCGIGGDTLALASEAPVAGLDYDPLRLAMAQANARALQPVHEACFAQTNLNDPLPFSSHNPAGLFFDPARRVDGRRVFRVDDYQPPLSVISGWLGRFPALGVKISPGVDLKELASYPAEIEFISLKGELKEAALWFGPLKTTGRRATLLPGGDSLTPMAGLGPDEPGHRHIPLGEPRAYLYEPDPAVLRAGLVQTLGLQLAAAQLDPDIAYLTAERHIETPFARSWQIEDWLPFSLKRLRQTLRARRVGRLTIKKRGSPLEPEALLSALRLDGKMEHERVLFLTHLSGRPVAIICYP